MKRFYIPLLIITLLSFITCSDNTQVNLETERAEVLKVLDNFNQAHENRDLDLLFLKVEVNISMRRFKRKQREKNSDLLVRITLSLKGSYNNIPTK